MRPGVVHVVQVRVDERPASDRPHVEVLDEGLWSSADMRSAVFAGAVTSGLVCAVAGFLFGFIVGVREGRR